MLWQRSRNWNQTIKNEIKNLGNNLRFYPINSEQNTNTKGSGNNWNYNQNNNWPQNRK